MINWQRKWAILLTHWGRVTHICVSKLTIIGSDNGLSPGRRQAIIWTNDGILLIRTLGTNFSEILGKIHSISFKKMHLKMSSAKGRLFNLGLNELKYKRRFRYPASFTKVLAPIQHSRGKSKRIEWRTNCQSSLSIINPKAVRGLSRQQLPSLIRKPNRKHQRINHCCSQLLWFKAWLERDLSRIQYEDIFPVQRIPLWK